MKILHTYTHKLKFHLSLLLLLSFFYLSAQVPNDADSTGFTREFIFEHLDLSQVPSGLLYDKAFPLVSLEDYDGLTPNDTNLIGTLGYRLLYATLYDAAITEADMLPDPLLNLGEVVEGNEIPFKMLFYRYDTFKEGAETSGLINIINNQLYDVSGAYDSPYEAKEVFVATPWCKTTLDIGTYQFTQDMITNIGTDIRNVKIDFGDGNGLQSWLSGSTLTVNYTSEGPKSIRLEVEFTGDTNTRICRSQIDIKVPEESIFDRYNITDTFGIQVAGGWITVLPFCGDSTIHKPLIVTNGVKIPGLFAANFDRPFLDLSEFENSPTGNFMLDDIESAGYDLIYINWANGVASLEDNGQVVVLLLIASMPVRQRREV